VELIPYFLALLAWIGLALGALLLSPFKAAIRLFRKSRAAPSTGSEVVPGPGPEPAIQPPSLAPPVPELPIEDPRSSV
jgi:hypothetical protein